jgi:hypothetical protein
MKDRQKLIRRVMREIDDLAEDLKFLGQVTEERWRDHEITTFVELENLGLIRHELNGLERLKTELEKFELTKDSHVDSGEEIKEEIRRIVQQHDLPNAVNMLMGKKIDRLVTYMTEESAE